MNLNASFIAFNYCFSFSTCFQHEEKSYTNYISYLMRLTLVYYLKMFNLLEESIWIVSTNHHWLKNSTKRMKLHYPRKAIFFICPNICGNFRYSLHYFHLLWVFQFFSIFSRFNKVSLCAPVFSYHISFGTISYLIIIEII